MKVSWQATSTTVHRYVVVAVQCQIVAFQAKLALKTKPRGGALRASLRCGLAKWLLVKE